MISVDEDALICDFAEVYHIYNYKELEIQKAAILACGLPASSRSIKKLTNQRLDLHTALLAIIADDLNLYLWMNSKDAKYKRNRPKSLFKLLNEEQEADKELKAFTSAEEFEMARKRILAGQREE